MITLSEVIGFVETAITNNADIKYMSVPQIMRIKKAVNTPSFEIVYNKEELEIYFNESSYHEPTAYKVTLTNEKDRLIWQLLVTKVIEYTHKKVEEYFYNYFKDEA